jgi:DNA-binding LacI/PurR family transcriptional regulator
MVAVVTSDIGRNTVACVAAGVQRRLQAMGYLLALGPSDCTSENISVQLHQRGIEGVIAIDATLSHGLKLPLACVDLESMSLVEPLGREMRAWFAELGESAADTVVQQIESETAPRKVKVVPKC